MLHKKLSYGLVLLLLLTVPVGCVNASKAFAEKMLVVDNDVRSQETRFSDLCDNQVSDINDLSDEITNGTDSSETISSIRQNLNDIKGVYQAEKKLSSQINSIAAPKNMKVKKEAYLRYLDEEIAGINDECNAANLLLASISTFDLNAMNKSNSQAGHGVSMFKSGRKGLQNVRSELNKIDNGK